MRTTVREQKYRTDRSVADQMLWVHHPERQRNTACNARMQESNVFRDDFQLARTTRLHRRFREMTTGARNTHFNYA
jgi:hypothetical protein